ncbi:MAG: ArgE/DapE family deacylase [bacterium]|nr:ArgE/DapE family deacylase [bacterium]
MKQDAAIRREIAAGVESLTGDMVAFIRKLVQTRSLPGEELRVQRIVADKLKSLNFDVDLIPIRQDILMGHKAFSHDGYPYESRANVIGHWRGNGSDPGDKDLANAPGQGCSLILNGHVDVVSPGDQFLWDDSPWSGALKDGRIYGRGSADMKSGLSAIIFACEVLQKLGFRPLKDVMIQSVAGEETGGCGTLTNIILGYTADAAIIAEPTRLNLYPVQAGALSFRIKITGKSIHACMKSKGVSAIEKFYPIFLAIEAFDRQRHRDYHDLVFDDPGNIAPINIGTLTSGDWLSTVPDKLVAEGRYGIFPGESLEAAKRAFEKTVKKTALADEWLKNHLPQVEWFEGQFEAGHTPVEEPLIQTLSACHQTVLNQEAHISGATYGSDLRLFTNHANIPAVLYGPGDVKEAHAANESIAVHEIVEAVNVYAFTILKWCGGDIR